MKKLALIALTTVIGLASMLPAQAGNPRYPQDATWDYWNQGANGGGGGAGGGGD